MTYKKRGPPGGCRQGLGEHSVFDYLNSPQSRTLKPRLQAFAIAWPTRRYGLTPRRTAPVADLAGLEGGR